MWRVMLFGISAGVIDTFLAVLVFGSWTTGHPPAGMDWFWLGINTACLHHLLLVAFRIVQGGFPAAGGDPTGPFLANALLLLALAVLFLFGLCGPATGHAVGRPFVPCLCWVFCFRLVRWLRAASSTRPGVVTRGERA